MPFSTLPGIDRGRSPRYSWMPFALAKSLPLKGSSLMSQLPESNPAFARRSQPSFQGGAHHRMGADHLAGGVLDL